MAETTKVVAKTRDRAGKGGARSSRRDGLIPAVIYGDKQPPVMIAVEPKTIERELHKEGYFNHRMKIAVDGGGPVSAHASAQQRLRAVESFSGRLVV